MPIYEYKCGECNHRFECIQAISAEKSAICPKCGGASKRIVSLAGFVLKGTGWYVTDYPSKDRKTGMESEKLSSSATSTSTASSTPVASKNP